MSHYEHLSIEERESIWELQHEGKGPREIGRELGRSASTISREVRRNSYLFGHKTIYRPSTAQRKYASRREGCKRRVLLEDETLQGLVERLIVDQGWSPEQVENRLKLEGSPYRISYTTIYRWLHAGKRRPWRPDARRFKQMVLHLRRRGRRKGANGEIKRQGRRNIPHKLSERPEAANKREEIGHWEADTIQGKINSGCVVTMVDRKSRFLLGGKVDRKFADDVAQAMSRLLTSVPPKYVKSITPDRGTEFTAHAAVTEQVHNVPFYFPPPHSPWARPSVENTNGLLRQYVPARSNLTTLTEADVRLYVRLLNTRPRKCLNWKTPAEVFFGKLLHLT